MFLSEKRCGMSIELELIIVFGILHILIWIIPVYALRNYAYIKECIAQIILLILFIVYLSSLAHKSSYFVNLMDTILSYMKSITL